MAKLASSAWRNIALGATVLLVAGACALPADTGNDQRKQVVTTFTVIADMARAVAGGHIAVHSLLEPGAEVHDYEPTPSDMLTAAKADLVLDNGLGLERWFQRFVQRSEARHVTLTGAVDPVPLHGGAPGAVNPHAWMSPRQGKTYVAAIRDALTRLDPAHAADFRANAQRYTARLDTVDRYLRAQLARIPERHRWLVTCEGAFSYLARDAGLREASLWPVNSESGATPQRITATTRLVREHDIPTVFCESTVSDRAQRQVARETGARLGPKLHVDSLSAPGGPVPTYLELLRHDARAIVTGLRQEAR
ncbi:metal ABC transporter substrate-binding protein [Salinifilum ghardaiensis]